MRSSAWPQSALTVTLIPEHSMLVNRSVVLWPRYAMPVLTELGTYSNFAMTHASFSEAELDR